MKKLAAMFTASQEEIREDLEGNTWVHGDTLVPEELQAVEQAHAELQDAHDDLVEAVDVADSIDETTALSQEALDSGNAALALKIATTGINAMCRRVGLESIDLMPSVEEGGGLKRAAAAAWDTLVKTFKAAWEKVKAFTAHIVSYFAVNKVTMERVKAALEKSKVKRLTVPDGATKNSAATLLDHISGLVNGVSESAERIKADSETFNFGTHLDKLAGDIAESHEVMNIEIVFHKKDPIDNMTVGRVSLVDGAEKATRITREFAITVLDDIMKAQDKVQTLLSEVGAAEKKSIAQLEKIAASHDQKQRAAAAFKIAISNQKQVAILVTKVVRLYTGLWHKAVTSIEHGVKTYKDGDHEYR